MHKSSAVYHYVRKVQIVTCFVLVIVKINTKRLKRKVITNEQITDT